MGLLIDGKWHDNWYSLREHDVSTLIDNSVILNGRKLKVERIRTMGSDSNGIENYVTIQPHLDNLNLYYVKD